MIKLVKYFINRLKDIESLKKIKMLLLSYFFILITSNIILIVYSINNNIYWLLGIIFFIPLYFYGIKRYFRFKKEKKVLKLRARWGQNLKRDRNFKDIRFLFDKKQKTDDKGIDDQTWDDLNFNQVYANIDHTLTSPGETVLYDILRKPLFNERKISKRNIIINVFQKDKNTRENIRLELLKLGRQRKNSLIKLLWGEVPKPTPYGAILNIMALLSLGVLGSFYFWGGKSLILLAIIMLINTGIIKYFKKKFFQRLPANSIRYLASLINTAEKIAAIESIDSKEVKDLQYELKKMAEKVNILTHKISEVIPNSIQGETAIIYEYFNTLFLIEVRSFNASLHEINKNIEKLKQMYSLIGEIDSLQSVASYRESLDYYNIPDLNKNSKVLKLKNAYHPLLDDPVPNSVVLDNKGIIITGSNMAGKSTFLRTVGINVILAQTIGTCLAKSYEGNMFKIISSISRTDNILKGKSYYYSEAERLLKLINSVENNLPSLCIIDELLSGTNSLERIHASQEILNYLYKNNVLTMVATHDLELAKKLKGKYKCYHFTDNVTKKGLDFDYTLKEGIAVTTNAIKLLQYLNYPDEITKKAYKKVDNDLEVYFSKA